MVLSHYIFPDWRPTSENRSEVFLEKMGQVLPWARLMEVTGARVNGIDREPQRVDANHRNHSAPWDIHGRPESTNKSGKVVQTTGATSCSQNAEPKIKTVSLGETRGLGGGTS